MEVVFAIDSLGSGGAQRQVVELAVWLRAAGVRSRIALYRGLAARDRDVYGARLAAAGVPVAVVAKRVQLDPSHPVRLGRVLRAADLVHAFMPAPTLWAWLALRTLPAAERPALLAAERSALANSGPVLRRIQAFVYRRARGVTVNSRTALAELASELRIPPECLHYLPNGIDLAAWDAAAAGTPPFEPEPGRFHVVVIGRLRPEKNHVLLLDALGRLDADERRDLAVWLLGASGSERQTVTGFEAELVARGLADVVRLVPATPAVSPLLRRMDLLVLPSHFEGFPNVVLEAMASRLLVVAAPVGDVPSLVDDGETGFLFEPEDAEALAQALRRARALSETVREAITGRARERVEQRYRMEAVAEQYLALYQRLVAARS